MIIKKRVCISVILTVFAIIFTNHFWLVRKPLDVKLYASGDNIKQIEVQLSKENSPEFKKFKSRISSEDIQYGTTLEYIFKKPRNPKWLKIVAVSDTTGGGARLTLSNINIKNHKYKLSDLENFSAKNASLRIQENQLIIIPDNKEFEISYNKPLDIRGSIKFDIKILLIIVILTYLASYKLTSYLADFKVSENKSRLDIIFLTIFFILLYIPMMKISDEEISPKENRRLAAYKPFIEHNEINYNFGKDFDSWFSDRFLLRDVLIPLYNKINLTLRSDFVETRKVDLIKSNGWMFEKYPNILTQEELIKIASNLNTLNQFCINHNIKLYILIPPAKEFYYRKYYSRYKNAPEDPTPYLVNYAKEKYDLDIIYPEKELRQEEKENYIYFKTDHHLTDYGSYIVYKVLMTKMSHELPMLKPTLLKDFNIYKRNLARYEWCRDFNEGWSYLGSGISDENVLKTEYEYYDYKYPENINILKNNSGYPYMQLNRKGSYKLLLLGDSFQENLTYFLNTNFNEIRKYRLNSPNDTPKRSYKLEMKPFENIAQKVKPDAILLIWNTGWLEHLEYMYPSEGK